MKRIALFLFALSALGSAISLHAQLVHVAVAGTVTEKFGGASWWTGPGSGEGASALLDFFYDSQASGVASPPPETNYWRLRFGRLDVTAPITSIAWENTSLFVETLIQSNLTTLNLELKFAAPALAEPLPVPPFPPLAPRSPSGGLNGYTSTANFDTLSAGGLGSGSLIIGVDNVGAELVPGSIPVPEPSTYAFGAALVLGGLTLTRRRGVLKTLTFY